VSKEKPYNNNTWTQARFNAFIKSALRSASVRWPPRYQVLEGAYVGTRINPKTNRRAKFYKCNKCLYDFVGKDVQVNHITPVVPVSGFDSWDGVIQRMFCEQSGLEVLCIPCHKTITDQENKERNDY
jgi:5-methylcytosine-specific restriction endonuclease McrA